MVFEYVVKEKTDLKSLLIKENFSLRIINKLFLEKDGIFINGKGYCGNYNLKENDNVKILLKEEKTSVKPFNGSIDIVYEDEYFLAVKKNKGLSTIPSKAHYEDNLSGRVLHYYKSKGIECGIHVINRLDFNTCGIVVFAKSKYIHQLISKQKITKKYRCLAQGIFENKKGIIQTKIDRENPKSIKRKVSDSGKPAITEYTVISENGGNSLLEICLITGRTHQIRVHMAYINHPLVGDTLYNPKAESDKDFYLLAQSIRFYCPHNKKEYVFSV